MSVTLSPYSNALYGANNYGGIQVTSVGFFDGPQNSATLPTGTPHAATFDFNQPTKVVA